MRIARMRLRIYQAARNSAKHSSRGIAQGLRPFVSGMQAVMIDEDLREAPAPEAMLRSVRPAVVRARMADE